MALQQFVIPSPGVAGINREKANSIIGPEWATVAQNAVVDLTGRFAARKGWLNQTTSAITGGSNPNNITTLHEYVTNLGLTSLVANVADNTSLYESTDNGATWSSITSGSITGSSAAQFVNFNGKVILGASTAPSGLGVKSTIGGTFTGVVATSGSVPTAPRGILSAFGRLWVISDLQTITYCALLDETKWAVADGAGSIDMRQVWTLGTDTITAVRAFSNRLIVFGTRHIVIFSDGRGSALGLDPTNIYVEDCIEGNGTSAPDSIQNIGEGDLLFLGRYGVQSLVRILQEQKTPINDLTKNNRQFISAIISTLDNAAKLRVKSAYSPEEGLYVLSMPSARMTFAIDTRSPLPDGTYRMFEWPQFYPTALCHRINGDLLFGFLGVVGKYTGYQDNGSPYNFAWYSGYLDMQDANIVIKALKSVRLLAATSGPYAVVIKWGFDFQGTTNSTSLTYAGIPASEYGIGQYGLSEYGGSALQHSDRIPGADSGQYLRIGTEVTINGYSFALQTLHCLYDSGRIS